MKIIADTLKKAFFFAAALLLALLLGGCSTHDPEAATEKSPEERPIQIGMSFDTFVLERWIRDRDVFVSTAAALGAEVNVQNANSNPAEQVAQIEYLIEKGVDAIVVIAIDAESGPFLAALEKAKNKGIYLIAYDRPINSINTDLYISFDNEMVGTLMAEAMISQIPDGGKVAALLGSPADYNVVLAEQGMQRVLDEHQIELVYKNYSDNWKAEHAYEQMHECLETVGAVDGVICGNDGLAAMAFKALSERRMADHVCIVGQDADIDACQRIVEGTQYMTVYKSIDELARLAAESTIKLIKKEPLHLTNVFSEGEYDVPFLNLKPVAVTSQNIDEEIIDSRFHLRNEVYLNVGKTVTVSPLPDGSVQISDAKESDIISKMEN